MRVRRAARKGKGPGGPGDEARFSTMRLLRYLAAAQRQPTGFSGYEEDEDPARVIAAFDAAPRGLTGIYGPVRADPGHMFLRLHSGPPEPPAGLKEVSADAYTRGGSPGTPYSWSDVTWPAVTYMTDEALQLMRMASKGVTAARREENRVLRYLRFGVLAWRIHRRAKKAIRRYPRRRSDG